MKQEFRYNTPNHIKIREILIEVAQRKHNNNITYSELIERAGLGLKTTTPHDRGELGHYLGEISWDEVQQKRPMLSSVAIHSGDKKPGQGFFDLAEDLYNKRLRTFEAKMEFWIEERNKTIELWQNHKKEE